MTFDDIDVRRPTLAKLYLELLAAQPGRPLALFAPRRVGKTYFLDHDLAPAAARGRWQPVYADLWLQKDAPLESINHTLEEALDDVQVPRSAAARLARTRVKKVGLLGAALDLDDAPARRALPASAPLRLDVLVTRLAAAAGKPVLLMLDEVQTLAEVASGEGIIAAVRAVLHKRRAVVAAVFTGSSPDGMTRMLATAGSPMYQFAQVMDFPLLGDEYLEALARHFASVHRGKSLGLEPLRRAFTKLGHKPRLMRDLVKAMSADGLTDVEQGLRRFVTDERQVAAWSALLQPLAPIDRLVLHAMAAGEPLLSRQTLERMQSALGAPATVAKVRAAVARLRRAGLVRSVPGAPATVEDPLFAEHLLSRNAR